MHPNRQRSFQWGILHRAGAVTAPLLTNRLKESGTTLLSWRCFCRLQGYFEVYGMTNLPACVFDISFVTKEVPGAEVGSEFPACFGAWLSRGNTVFRNAAWGRVSI